MRKFGYTAAGQGQSTLKISPFSLDTKSDPQFLKSVVSQPNSTENNIGIGSVAHKVISLLPLKLVQKKITPGQLISEHQTI